MTLVGRKLRVEYGGNTILHNVDFVARPGELVGVLGPSGSGKSTLLMALSGFRPAHKGSVHFQGEDLYARFEALKRKIGFVPQDDIVPRALKVERVLHYAADLRLEELPPEVRRGRVTGVLQKLGLAERRNLKVSRLSGGQRKRVSVGVELLSRPEVLFADEPTSGLDPALERSLTQTFKDLTEDGSIVVITTHIMTSLDLIDKLCVVHGGRLVFFGTARELKAFFEVEDYVAVYSRLEAKPAAEWQKKFQQSPLHGKYLA